MSRLNLNSVTNTAVLAMCAIWAVRAGVEHFNPTKPAAGPVPVYAAGTKLPEPAKLDLKPGALTLFIATRSTCPWCKASMPFYQKLVPAAQRAGARVIGITGEDPSQNRRYYESNAVTIETVKAISGTPLKIDSIPALLVVRGDGTVVKEWVGKLEDKEEKEVLKTLGATL